MNSVTTLMIASWEFLVTTFGAESRSVLAFWLSIWSTKESSGLVSTLATESTLSATALMVGLTGVASEA